MSLYFVVNFNIFVLSYFILKHLNHTEIHVKTEWIKISSNKRQLTIVKKPSLSSLYNVH